MNGRYKMSKTKKPIKPKVTKVETIDEYIARGGTIKKIPEHIPEEKKAEITVKSTSGEPPQPMTILDGAWFWAEKIDRNKTPKPSADLEAVPQSLIEYLTKRGKL